MRKISPAFIATVISVAALISGCGSSEDLLPYQQKTVVAIEDTTEPEVIIEEVAEEVVEIVETGIELHTDNIKKEYLLNEELNLTNLTVHMLYSDGHKEDLTEGYTVSEVDMSSYGEKEIIVTYGDFTETFVIDVTYTVEDIEAKTMYSTTSLNIRKGPSTDFETIGSLKVNEEVKVTGKADNGWSRIEYKENEYFVSSKYLSDKKIELTTPVNTDTTGLMFDGAVSSDCKNKALQLYGYVPSNVKQAIVSTGYTVIVTTNPAYTDGHAGTYNPYGHPGGKWISIYAKSVNAVNIAIIHEIGHFVDNYVGARDGHAYNSFGFQATSSTAEFREIYASEVGTSGFPGYATDCIEDYFAEAYWKALTKPSWCQQTIPRTYEYVMRQANSI